MWFMRDRGINGLWFLTVSTTVYNQLLIVRALSTTMHQALYQQPLNTSTKNITTPNQKLYTKILFDKTNAFINIIF